MLLTITEKRKKGIELNKEEIEYKKRTAKKHERVVASFNKKVNVLKNIADKSNGGLVLEEKHIHLIANELVASEYNEGLFNCE